MMTRFIHFISAMRKGRRGEAKDHTVTVMRHSFSKMTHVGVVKHSSGPHEITSQDLGLRAPEGGRGGEGEHSDRMTPSSPATVG